MFTVNLEFDNGQTVTITNDIAGVTEDQRDHFENVYDSPLIALTAYDEDGELANYWTAEGDGDDDGQPTEYEEWQDYMGGDDWDHGQYDDAF